MNLYLTADKIGAPTGGGLVTAQELLALQTFGQTVAVTLDHSKPPKGPFEQDAEILSKVQTLVQSLRTPPRLAHCYSGCLSETVAYLKSLGTRVSYTIAAHDKAVSKAEHEKLGVPFAYPHLVEESQWQRYLAGYAAADVIICPGTYPAGIVRGYPYRGPIEVIPHGCTLPDTLMAPARRFTLGYLGSCTGIDKGIVYLLQAWKKLHYKDAVLILGGRDSIAPQLRQMIGQLGGGSILLKGWVNQVSEFYNELSAYCQPSATEGFGLEVLEAMAHGRSVLCSAHAGAADLVPADHRFAACDVVAMAERIDALVQQGWAFWQQDGVAMRERARAATWDKIRARYNEVWWGMLLS